MANILTIKEKIDNGQTVTIPTRCISDLMEQADAHLKECDWLIKIRGDVTHISKPNASGESRGTPRTLDPVVGSLDGAE